MVDELEFRVDTLSAYNLLDYSGEDWPQPRAGCMPHIDWDTLEVEHPTNSTDSMQAFYQDLLKPVLKHLENRLAEAGGL